MNYSYQLKGRAEDPGAEEKRVIVCAVRDQVNTSRPSIRIMNVAQYDVNNRLPKNFSSRIHLIKRPFLK